MEEDPFPDLSITDSSFLREIKERSTCPKCGKSRKFYCYTCFLPLPNTADKTPKIKLPLKIDIIKHPNEVDGKSTAVHAATLAPEDVTMYTYPTIPAYSHPSKVLLVFPGENSMTFENYVKMNGKTKEPKIEPKLDKKDQLSSSETETKQNAFNSTDEKADILDAEVCTNIEQPETAMTSKDKDKDHTNTDSETPSAAKKMKLSDHATSDDVLQVSELLHVASYESGLIERVVFIDSTWHQVHRIATDDRLKGLQQIELKSRETKFWRHQQDKPSTYLATVEAVYYLVRDYHTLFVGTPYRGEYDDLLFYFKFMYFTIKDLYVGGKYIKAYTETGRKKKTNAEKRKERAAKQANKPVDNSV